MPHPSSALLRTSAAIFSALFGAVAFSVPTATVSTNRHIVEPSTFSTTDAPQKRGSEVETISCGQEIPYSDENGTWQLRFQCFQEYGVVNWHFNFSPEVRAIAASPATEDGLRWWRNGSEQPKNAPHVIPVDYTLHGTLSRVHVGDVLDYQDYITFRHDIGSGGIATVTFAGSIRLVY